MQIQLPQNSLPPLALLVPLLIPVRLRWFNNIVSLFDVFLYVLRTVFLLASVCILYIIIQSTLLRTNNPAAVVFGVPEMKDMRGMVSS